MLYLAADHAGFEQKEYIAHKLETDDIAFEDFGTFSKESTDYPRYAKQIAKAVQKSGGRGIVFCGSGEGMAIAANRFKGIRASVAWSPEIAHETRHDNDSNVLSIPSRFINNDQAWDIIRTFLSTSFSHEDRHKRRIKQLDE